MLPKGITSTKKFYPHSLLQMEIKTHFLAAPKRVVQLEDETDNALIFSVSDVPIVLGITVIYNTKDGNRLHPLFRERTFMT